LDIVVGSSRLLAPSRFSEAYALSSPVIVNELDPGGLERPPHRKVIRCGQLRLMFRSFSTPYRIHAERRLSGEILCGPFQERTRGSDLRTAKWAFI